MRKSMISLTKKMAFFKNITLLVKSSTDAVCQGLTLVPLTTRTPHAVANLSTLVDPRRAASVGLIEFPEYVNNSKSNDIHGLQSGQMMIRHVMLTRQIVQEPPTPLPNIPGPSALPPPITPYKLEDFGKPVFAASCRCSRRHLSA